MFIDKDTVDLLKKKYKSSSINTISNNMKRIFHKGLMVYDFDKNLLISKIDNILIFVESLKHISVKKSMIHNIRAIVGKDVDIYNMIMKKYNKEHTTYKVYEMPGKGMVKKFRNLETIKNMISKFDSIKQSKMIKKVIISLYVYLPPLRGQEFYTTIIRYDDKKTDKNYLNLKNSTLVISDYKTFKYYGIRKIKLPEVLMNTLNEFIDFMKLEENDNMLVNRNREPYKQSAFTHILWRIFGKNVSVDMLRKTYIVEINKYLLKFDDCVLWRKRLAKMIGHSLSTQEFVYSGLKFVDIEYSSDQYMSEVLERLKYSFIEE